MVVRGARVIDPYRQIDSRDEDVWIADGHIVSPAQAVSPSVVVNASHLWLVPRLIDMHVHFREPGQTWKETIATGSRAAAHGGIVAVAAMPNTEPVVDTPELVEWVQHRGQAVGLVRVLPLGAITVGSRGEELADLYRMHQAGAVGFSDDGNPVSSAAMMRAALSYARTLPAAVINHAQERSLSEGGVVHEGRCAHRLGLAGMPEVAESSMVWRDVLLAGLTGGRLHEAHLSTMASVEAIGYAKQHHYRVTAEVTPHHLLLNEEVLLQWGYDPVTKVNPPIRPEATRQALLKAVQSGLIDVLASDHAPHHDDDKAKPYPEAPFGISGLETIVAALMTALVQPGCMSPLEAFGLMTTGPDRVLGLGFPGLRAGALADLTLIDPQKVWTVDPDRFYSLGHNTPLAGMQLRGQALATMVGGQWTMQEGEVLDAGLFAVS
ncbi:MAG: dihydroorotase [Sulfobacillus acidophilus]|uniref:Dihydroorotase n=1 Tax=Sulfobacillus acidophilus TaxID=53633 RepID=A0A2T2WFI3_9FIRM|nr:MAG: dihydroorotase [Sulfobacillus acidophilus]